VLTVFLIKIEKSSAQDFHYTQFYNSPMNLNPALTGVFNGDHRFIGSLRQQWSKINEAWMTFGGSYDSKIMPKKSKNSFIGWGLQFNYDQDGLSKLSLANLNLSGSYNHFLNKNNILTAGLMLGYASRGFNPDALSWDEQWSGVQYVSSLNSGESYNMERVGIIETGVGLNYRWQKSSRTKVDLGAGFFHLNAPEANYYSNDDQNLPRKLSLYGIGNLQLTQYIDLQLHIMNQNQGEYTETVFGGLAKFYLNQKKGRTAQLHVGAGYRSTESVFPTIAVQWGNVYVGANYDVDLSPFNTLTSKRGGPEVHVRYIIANVKPLGLNKACPIF